MKCRVCGNEIKGQGCARCGFLNVAALDKESFERQKKASDAMRESILDGITDISVDAYGYRYNGRTEKLERTDRIIKIADGRECFGTLKWADADLACGKTFPDIIELKYKIRDKIQSAELRLKKKPEGGNLRIGVGISGDFGIYAVIGTRNGQIESKKEQLRLI